jgi:glyoxylase I family protein
MSRVLSVHHVSLLVADTLRALEFYHGILGIPVDDNRPELGYPGAWLHIGRQQIHLLELADPEDSGKITLHGGRDRHFALHVDELDYFRKRLEERGIDYTPSSSGRRALFCRDFDGNAVELIESVAG